MKALKRLLNNKGKMVYSLVCLFCIIFHFTVSSASTAADRAGNPVSKGQEQFTYLALGDSLTAGLGASETNYLRLTAFVPQLTSYLRQKQPVSVENHGIPGLTSAQLITYLQSGLGAKGKIEQADLITITIGGNDLLQLLANKDNTELTEQELEQIILQFSNNLTEALALISSHNPDVPIYVLDLYSPYPVNHPLYEVSEQGVNLFNRELNKIIAARQQVQLVSVYHEFLNNRQSLTHIAKQDIHPNDSGYKIIFEAFRKSIVQ